MDSCSVQTVAQHEQAMRELEMHLCCLGNKAIPSCGLVLDSRTAAAPFPANVLGFAMPFYPLSLKDYIL